MPVFTFQKLKTASSMSYKTSLIFVAVVLMHLGVLWAVQNGSFKSTKPTEVVIPIALLPIHPIQSKAASSPAPQSLKAEPLKSESKPPTQAELPSVVVANSTQKPIATLQQAPTVVSENAIETSVASAASSHSTVQMSASTASTASSAASATSNSVTTTVSDAKQAQVQLPSADADYLQNRKPKRSILSEKTGEFGRVLIYTVISAEGLPLEIKVDKSSGFPRLDSAALEAVRTWRFKPGKVGGVPAALPYLIPITFEP